MFFTAMVTLARPLHILSKIPPGVLTPAGVPVYSGSVALPSSHQPLGPVATPEIW